MNDEKATIALAAVRNRMNMAIKRRHGNPPFNGAFTVTFTALPQMEAYNANNSAPNTKGESGAGLASMVFP